jgi:outer membrane protein TolC
MQLIVQKLGLKRAKFYQEYTVSQLKEQEAQLLKKAISAAQIFDPRMAAEQAQIAFERSDYDYANARLKFGRLAGTGPIADEEVPDSIPAVNYDAAALDQLLAGFLGEKDPPTAEAAVLREQIKIENLQYANAKTRLRPKVSALLAMTKDQQNNLYGQGLDYSVTSIYGGLSVNWTIFDGFNSNAGVRGALASRRRAENTYLQVTERLARDAQTQVKLINFAARNVSVTEKYLTSAEGFLSLRKEEKGRGVRSDAEVSQAQTNLYDVQINTINARADFLLKTSEFLGTIVEDPALSNLVKK